MQATLAVMTFADRGCNTAWLSVLIFVASVFPRHYGLSAYLSRSQSNSLRTRFPGTTPLGISAV